MNALELLAAETKIPVPKLIECGRDPKRDNTWFIKTELRQHTVRGADVAEYSHCFMPARHGRPQLVGSTAFPNLEGSLESPSSCGLCVELAKKNMDDFVESVLRPELAKLRSRTSGLKGIVIPPGWVLAKDKRDKWLPKTVVVEEKEGCEEPPFCFVHFDLAPYNILLSTDTLEVDCVIDFEQTGFASPEMQLWLRDSKTRSAVYNDDELMDRHTELLS